MRCAAAALIVAAVALVVVKPSRSDFMPVPGGTFRAGSPESGGANPPHEVNVGPFEFGRTEITCAEYATFLNATTGQPPAVGAGQFEKSGGRWTARDSRKPVAWVALDDALAYCKWQTEASGQRVRLPTAEEWECSARGGIDGARFPWGWGDPAERACFDAKGPARVASHKPNAFGLYDMAGNVAEWCESPSGVVALGGSWADRDPEFLRVFHRASFPRDYRDGDVGFRVLVEVR
jgi:formylglycine-generating enzyme required for sulfatase activity